MRFQTPALAIGLFASLALASEKPTVRVQTLYDGPGDDATLYCILKTEGLCENADKAANETKRFGLFNEKTQKCEIDDKSNSAYELCGKDDKGEAKALIRLLQFEDGPTLTHFSKESNPGHNLLCYLDTLESNAECNPEVDREGMVSTSETAPAPDSSSIVPASSTALPTPSPSVAVKRHW